MTGEPGEAEVRNEQFSTGDDAAELSPNASTPMKVPAREGRAHQRGVRRIVLSLVGLLIIVGIVVAITRHSTSSGTKGSSGVQYDADTVSPTSVDPCALLTAATLGSITGSTYSAGTAAAATNGSPTCTFNSTTDGSYVNVEVSTETFGSLAQWSGTIGFMLNYQGQSAGGPWIAGSSATLSNGTEIDFLAGRLNIAVLSNGVGEQAIYQAATAAAAHFTNASTSPGGQS